MTATAPRRRPIRTFVLREGRLTAGQRRALDVLLPRYGLALPQPSGGAVDYRRVFGRTAPLRLEIGFGDGGALLQMAEQNPHCDFIGAEVHRPGVGRLLLQIEARQLANVRLFCDDGILVLSRAIAPRALDALYLYFPDPWPKKKHHKRRLLQSAFIELAASRLAVGGCLHFATDWEPYAVESLERLEQCGGLENRAGRGKFSPRPPDRPETKFERRGRKLGHRVWDVVMWRVAA